MYLFYMDGEPGMSADGEYTMAVTTKCG
jgi:hypothetical protein